ncbi:hypothetical protein P154DRAFT_612278 [Amniculicola lignicola CBS 123094]|uniref:RING-type domain-containing protein n=1 Tax=Amniculicola lignicola CBS 123094 TaxID=1392246 RepID=A0A6A5W200_9PLEO|nr:hypothetical protein P154DRAFT_612278 [Amniculicola lignicola CBS 123094]
MQDEEYNIHAASQAPNPDDEFLFALEQEALWQEEVVANPQIDEDYALALQMRTDIQLEEIAPATRDCVVCGETIPIPELPALMACIHPPQTCAECFSGWIASELESKGWRDIKCPEANCKETIQHIEVQLIAKPEVFQRYDQLSTREAINDDPDWKWCLRPRCPSGQIHPNGDAEPIITCNECGFRMCAKHNREWHVGETCQEYDYRVSGQKDRDQAAQEAASQAAVNQLSRKCPGKKCAYSIEKNDGCDHMTCSKCKYEFCWLCSADYNKIRRVGNKAHNAGCKYYA